MRAAEGSLRQSAAAMKFHRQMLASARGRVAGLSQPNRSGAIKSSTFQRIHRTLVDHWERLRDYPNVVGYGAGFRFKDGVRTNKRCASILVREKLPRKALARGKGKLLPTTLHGSGYSVPVDVVEVGEFSLYANPSDRITGHSTQVSTVTLGAFAVDNATNAVLALTAMHAAGNINQFPPPGGSEVPIHFLAEDGSLLGDLLRGTRGDGIDAGAIKLAAGQTPSRMLPGVGEMKSWRVLDQDADTGTAVTMFGALTGHPVHGAISNPCVFMPEMNLGPAIQVSIRAQRGDSGAALVDRDNFLLGLLVGGGEETQFFSPIGNIFNVLSCDLF